MTQERLLIELTSYQGADEAEIVDHGQMIDLVRTAGAFSRHRFEPGHITASCFIIDGEGRLLLHHHRRLDRWLQMGGHLEEGETPVSAALREGREESRLDDLELVSAGILDLDIHAIPAGKGEPPHQHFDVRYLARTRKPEAIAIDPSESNEIVWVALDGAVSLMNEPSSTRAIRKIERWLR